MGDSITPMLQHAQHAEESIVGKVRDHTNHKNDKKCIYNMYYTKGHGKVRQHTFILLCMKQFTGAA